MVVEDAAEAHGATYKGRPTGSLADIATFSFYGNKILTCGEGGAITTDNEQLAKRVRTLKGQGVDPNRRYFFPVTGYNFRLTNLACAILCGQLERKDEILQKRRDVYALYNRHLAGIPGINHQPAAEWAEVAPWLYSITVDAAQFGMDSIQLATQLKQKGIDSRPFFTPLHLLPPFRRESAARKEHLPETEKLSKSGMNLPTFTPMEEFIVKRIADAIRSLQRS